MFSSDMRDSTTKGLRGADLSRRSLIAAGAIVATIGPSAMSRVLAQGKGNSEGNPNDGGVLPGCQPSDTQPKKCLCFLRGTRLTTPSGEAAIEELKIGDFVSTSGGARAIRWIGQLEFVKETGSSWQEEALPVRIAKNALGAGSPHRDLFVSGAHMLYLNGVLIPAANLVNGVTITVVAPDVDALQYFHVEFDQHDVVLAEGAPCESLLATSDSRQVFDNYEDYVALYGLLPTDAMTPFAPIASFNGGRSEFKSRLRSALAPVIDIRRPADVVRDDIEARAGLSTAA